MNPQPPATRILLIGMSLGMAGFFQISSRGRQSIHPCLLPLVTRATDTSGPARTRSHSVIHPPGIGQLVLRPSATAHTPDGSGMNLATAASARSRAVNRPLIGLGTRPTFTELRRCPSRASARSFSREAATAGKREVTKYVY